MNGKSLTVGLKMHKRKSKSMTDIDTTANIQTDGTEIEKMIYYRSLGQTTAMENRTRQKVLIRQKA